MCQDIWCPDRLSLGFQDFTGQPYSKHVKKVWTWCPVKLGFNSRKLASDCQLFPALLNHLHTYLYHPYTCDTYVTLQHMCALLPWPPSHKCISPHTCAHYQHLSHPHTIACTTTLTHVHTTNTLSTLTHHPRHPAHIHTGEFGNLKLCKL